MQQTFPNFCKCFGQAKTSLHQDAVTPTTPQTNSCRCTPNACPPDDKFLLICCNECVVNGPRECGKPAPAPAPACQVSCAQQAQTCTCCACRKCPICLIRNLCRETWDAYQKENTARERYSLFEGGPSLTSDLQQAKTKPPSEFSTTKRGQQLLGQVDKTTRKSDRENEEDKKGTKRVNKKDKYKDSDEDIGIKGKKKRKQKREMSEDEIEDKSKKPGKSKKGSKDQPAPDSSADKKKSSKLSKGGRKASDDSDEDVSKGGKRKGSKKGGTKKSKSVDDDEEDEFPQSKKGKPQKKATKGKAKVVEDSDDEVPSKTKGKKGKSGQEAKGKPKDVKSKDTFRDGDKTRSKSKAKGGRGDRTADAVDSEDSDMRVDKRGRKITKQAAKSTQRQKDGDTMNAKGKSTVERKERSARDREQNQKFFGKRKTGRDSVDSDLKDYQSSDESLIDRLYKERIAKLNALGRKLNTSDYMRLRLEQRDLKDLGCKRMPDVCCAPCRPCHMSSPCGADPCVCVPNNCCCPSSYFK